MRTVKKLIGTNILKLKKNWIIRKIFNSADSFTILPNVHLGTRYVAVGTTFSLLYPNVIMAVAYENNTTVTSIGLFND